MTAEQTAQGPQQFPQAALEAVDPEASLLPRAAAPEESTRRACTTWRLPAALATVCLSAPGAVAVHRLVGSGAPVLSSAAAKAARTSLQLREECAASELGSEDCGEPGMTQEQCEAKGCCYDEANPVHWCWTPAEMLWECNPDASRGDGGDCGDVGITQAQCEERGCCYDEGNPEHWCFPKTRIGLVGGGGEYASGPSLFCFAVACSDDERAVLALQKERGTGIFDCQDWKTIDGRTMSSMGGGLTGSWTNVDTFMAAWKSVDGDGRWRDHEWTVKADPDTAWVPQRLRDWLELQGDPGAGAFVNNCMGVDNGFYGALEVMSSGAMAVYLREIDNCWSEMQDRKGDMGEDLFAQWCMQGKGVQGWDFGELICNQDCGCDPRPCDTGRIAYHPFKGVEDHENCINQL